MRLGKAVNLQSVAQALNRHGCPICAYLKNEQAALLRGGMKAEEIVELCSFHAWALAAAVDVQSAAEVFLRLVKRRAPSAGECSVCARLVGDQVVQLRILLKQLSGGLTSNWMRQQGVLCRLHGDHLRQLAPESMRPVIDEIMDRTAKQLEEDLLRLLESAKSGDHSGGGVLGRVAEFLTSQRGVNH